jgi:hypothetical protein
MRRFVTAIAALAATALAAAPAGAATPFSAGSGLGPNVAVGPDGSGHVVWQIRQDGPDAVGYCRVPKGGGACDRAHRLQFPGTDPLGGETAQAVVAPDGRIHIYASCFDCPDHDPGVSWLTHRWTSSANGDAFAPPALVARGIDFAGRGAYRPASQLNEVFVAAAAGSGTGHDRLQAMDLSAPTASVPFHGFSLSSHSGEVARDPNTPGFVAVADDLHDLRFAYYSGASPMGVAQLNAPGNWTADRPIDGPDEDVSNPRLAGGTSGLFLAYRRNVGGDFHVGLRRYDGPAHAFTAPAYIQGGSGIDVDEVFDVDLAQDAAGRLHAVWHSGYQNDRLRYTRSDDGGATFSAPANLAASEVFARPRVAAGADGQGFATWQDGGGSGAIRVVALDPQPEPAAPPQAPPAAKPPAPPGAPPLYGGRTRTRYVNGVGGTKLGIEVPRGCLLPGQRYRVTLKIKRAKRKGRVVVKIRKATFYVQSKLKKTDKKAPFRQVLQVDSRAARGGAIKLRVRAFIKVGKGKKRRSKSIHTTLRVCG